MWRLVLVYFALLAVLGHRRLVVRCPWLLATLLACRCDAHALAAAPATLLAASSQRVVLSLASFSVELVWVCSEVRVRVCACLSNWLFLCVCVHACMYARGCILSHQLGLRY